MDWEPHILPRPPITELAVCLHAREVLLRIYMPCFKHTPYRLTPDLNFAWGSGPEGRWLAIIGMGKRSPRSPYANLKTDVFLLPFHMMYKIQFGETLQTFLSQEAIENVQNIVMLDNSWAPRLHSAGARGLRGKPDRKLVLLQFTALKNLYFANEPSVRIEIPPAPEGAATVENKRPGLLPPDDEILAREKLALTTSYAEGKILVLADDVKYSDPHFKLDLPRQWIERQLIANPNWSVPVVKMAKIIPDPRG